MSRASEGTSLEKTWVLKRIGYSLVAIALVFLMLLLYIPEFKAPALVAYSYIILGAGIVLVLLNKVREIIQQSRIKNSVVRCMRCGWFGLGKEWTRGYCCPECDSEEVVLWGPVQ